MIQLLENSIWVEKPSGSTSVCTAEQITIELMGGAIEGLDPEMVRQAAAGVLHYFKVELGREFVTVGEFSTALAKVLKGFGLDVESTALIEGVGSKVVTTDLRELAKNCGDEFELGFFVRLRERVKTSLADSPKSVQFQGLRSCVKQLARARRWSARCQQLQEQIVNFLRECLEQEAKGRGCSMLVK
jgi:hypothetical protein